MKTLKAGTKFYAPDGSHYELREDLHTGDTIMASLFKGVGRPDCEPGPIEPWLWDEVVGPDGIRINFKGDA